MIKPWGSTGLVEKEVLGTLHFLLTLAVEEVSNPFLYVCINTAELSPVLGKLILQCDSKGAPLHLLVCDLIPRPAEWGYSQTLENSQPRIWLNNFSSPIGAHRSQECTVTKAPWMCFFPRATNVPKKCSMHFFKELWFRWQCAEKHYPQISRQQYLSQFHLYITLNIF